jgi:rhodanese-related sulfurtransferase
MKIIFLLSVFLSFNIFANSQKINLKNFKTLTTEEVQQQIAKDTVIIDIRRPDEWQKYGVIPNSKRLTFFDSKGKYNVELWLKKLKTFVKDEHTPFILVCAHANRTKVVGKFLNDKTNYKNIYELQGGIKYGWIDKGFATTKIPANPNKTKAWYQFW